MNKLFKCLDDSHEQVEREYIFHVMTENLRKRIHEANVEFHRFEAKYYELIHPEIFNRIEQKRLVSTLRKVDKLIDDNQKKALDFGAGTGNLTCKLLNMGYEVTAVDISAEMCELLKDRYVSYLRNKRLRVINSKIEDISFSRDKFDLITCYSVLHHLPDYVDVIRKLTFLLKKGGVVYLDHEESPFIWDQSQNHKKLQHIYLTSNWYLDFLTNRIRRSLNITRSRSLIDYALADYWTRKKEHRLDHKKIEHVFEEENFTFLIREDYHLHKTRILNPIFYIYKFTCKPDMSLWIARK